MLRVPSFLLPILYIMHSLSRTTLYLYVAFVAFANAAANYFSVTNVVDVDLYGQPIRHDFSFDIEDPNTVTYTICELDLLVSDVSVVPPIWVCYTV